MDRGEGEAVTLADLTAAIDMLRARGVAKYTDIAGGGFTVEFFAEQSKPGPMERAAADEKCACGHASHEHGGGLCLLGCDPTKCSPEPT